MTRRDITPSEATPVEAATAFTAAAGGGAHDPAEEWLRAQAFAQPLLAHQVLASGENALDHAQAMATLIEEIDGSPAMRAACFLVYAAEYLNQPQEVIAKAFGSAHATLAMETLQLLHLQRQALQAKGQEESSSAASRHENVRRMLLAFSRDLRVVLLRLSSRLQTLRWYAASRRPVPRGLADESLQVFAPLANRLGIWQIKWELEDLSFRFLEPDTYRTVARQLDETRAAREQSMQELRDQVAQSLRAQGLQATVQGRPKHIYSIVKKMRGKSLRFDQIFDLRALRVVVPAVADCYAALSLVHSLFQPVEAEYDDYIARPKSNGYQSLHTVVRDAQGRAIEIQIRTQTMHDHAEHGVAAHWAYKEAGAKGYAGVSATGSYDAKIAVLRQLLAWEREMSHQGPAASGATDVSPGLGKPPVPVEALNDRIYVLTPDAAVIELPQGATAIDFAYLVHTNLGHRCRGARVDGQMVTLNTPLRNGQTVEIVAAKEGGPSRDWLNPELGFLASPRSRAKVRAWFNAQIQQETMARGREMVERWLQREGKTSVRLDDLAERLGFKSADALFEAAGKDTLSQRQIEQALQPQVTLPVDDDAVQLRRARGADTASRSGVLVVGVDSLLTQLARCCKPAPPDEISGFVTRGKGVSVHRQDCPNFLRLQQHSAGRVIDVDWGRPRPGDTVYYPVDVSIEAMDRQGLLRDISDVFAKEKVNVIGVQTQSVKGVAWMTFTVEVSDTERLHKVLGLVCGVTGVRSARRR
jgi:GTP pyrophosphokinase